MKILKKDAAPKEWLLESILASARTDFGLEELKVNDELAIFIKPKKIKDPYAKSFKKMIGRTFVVRIEEL